MNHRSRVGYSQPHFTHHSPKSTLKQLSLVLRLISIFFLLSLRIFRESKAPSVHFFTYFSICKSVYENKPFPLGKMRGIDEHMIDVSVLSANPKFTCTGEHIIQKLPEFGQAGIQLDSSSILSRLCYQNKSTRVQNPASYAGYTSINTASANTLHVLTSKISSTKHSS